VVGRGRSEARRGGHRRRWPILTVLHTISDVLSRSSIATEWNSALRVSKFAGSAALLPAPREGRHSGLAGPVV
jgi:hypothetical protein